MNSDVATSISSEDARPQVVRRSSRAVAVQLLGPLTIVAGLAWAVAQPYRIVLLDGDRRGLYDYLFQGPLLAIAVGLVYTLVIAPGLVEDLEEAERDGSAA